MGSPCTSRAKFRRCDGAQPASRASTPEQTESWPAIPPTPTSSERNERITTAHDPIVADAAEGGENMKVQVGKESGVTTKLRAGPGGEPESEERDWIVTTRDEETSRSTWRIQAKSAEEAKEKMNEGDFDGDSQITNDYEGTHERTVIGVAPDVADLRHA